MHTWSQLIIGTCRYLTSHAFLFTHLPTYAQKPTRAHMSTHPHIQPHPPTHLPTPTCVHTVRMSKYLKGLTVGSRASMLTVVVCTVDVKDAVVVLSGRTTRCIVDANGRPFWTKPMTRSTHKAHITPATDRHYTCNHRTAHSSGQ